MREHQLESTVTPSTRLQPSEDLPVKDAAFQGQFDPLGGITTPTASSRTHAIALNRATDSRPWRARHSLLRLQRDYGNHYVRRVLDLAKQGQAFEGSTGRELGHLPGYDLQPRSSTSLMIRRQDGDGDGDGGSLADKPKTPFPPDLPDTRYCTVDVASGKLNCCAEVAQGKVCLDDWGKFKDWLKGQQAPAAPPCPAGQTVSPVGCCPQGQSWDGTKCSAPSSPTFPQQCLPGEQPTLFGTCCKPGQVMDSFGHPCATMPAPPEEQPLGPGDYNVPDESNVAVA